MWYWYVAQDNELMIDCDGSALLSIAEKRLQRSSLPITSVYVSPSASEDHFHLVVKLSRKMPAIERQVWQLYLMDHVYRSVNNLFRAIERIPAPCLLISDHQWEHPKLIGAPEAAFWRGADAVCRCKRKHKGPNLSNCKIGLRLRGYQESEFNKLIGTNR